MGCQARAGGHSSPWLEARGLLAAFGEQIYEGEAYMRDLILTIDIDETFITWPKKITAQNERYLDHIYQRHNLLSFD